MDRRGGDWTELQVTGLTELAAEQQATELTGLARLMAELKTELVKETKLQLGLEQR